jgi:hypothetical protein
MVIIRNILTSLVVSTLVFGCKENKRICKVEKVVVSPISSVDSTYFENRNIFQSALGVDNLTDGFDSVAVRINIKFSRNSLNCKIFTLEVDRNQISEAPAIANKNVQSFSRYFNRHAILDSLRNYGLFSIRTDEEIPGWGWGLHNVGWIVQYTNCKEYRIYSNNSFLDKYNRTRQTEAENIVKIIKFLESEFGIELIPEKYY